MEDDRSSLPFSLNGLGHYQQIPLVLLLGTRLIELMHCWFIFDWWFRFCLADLPDLQKFHFELMHCSLDFHFVIWHYPGWSASCQILYPKSTHVSRGQKQRSAALGGEHVITCVLQELDWFTYLRSGLVGISGSIVSSSTHQCCSVFCLIWCMFMLWFHLMFIGGCSTSIDLIWKVITLQTLWFISFGVFTPVPHGCQDWSILMPFWLKIDQSISFISAPTLVFSGVGGSPHFASASAHRLIIRVAFLAWWLRFHCFDPKLSLRTHVARGSLSADPVGFALGETFDRADALLKNFRLVISFLSGRFARSSEVSFRADALLVGFSFCDLTLSWLISQLSDSVPQIYPRLSGSKTEVRCTGGWACDHMRFARTWLIYIYIYMCEWGKRWSTPGFEVSALFWDKLLGIKTAFFAQNGEFIWMVLDSFRSYWCLVSSPSDVVLTRYIQTVTPCCSPLNILRGACWACILLFLGPTRRIPTEKTDLPGSGSVQKLGSSFSHGILNRKSDD